MKITEALTAQLTQATEDGGDVGNWTTVVPGSAGGQQVPVVGYVTIIVIVAVVVLFVVGVAVYKTCTVSWVSIKTAGRRSRHDSGHWLTSDNPAMWDDEAPYGEPSTD